MNPIPFVIAFVIGLGGYLLGDFHTGLCVVFGWLCFTTVFNVIVRVRQS